MDGLLRDLKRTNKVDCSDLTPEAGLFRSFDQVLRRQLDPIWNTLSKRTRQIVADLATMRQLARALLKCVPALPAHLPPCFFSDLRSRPRQV